MNLTKTVLVTALVTLCFLGVLERSEFYAWADPDDRPKHAGMVCLFGTLHAHSSLSKDIHDAAANALTPQEVYEYARTKGLDFIGISDHHKAKRFNNGNQVEKLRIPPSVFTSQLVNVAKAFNQQHSGKFVAIAGIEWGGIRIGNHVNLFGIEELPPDSVGPKDYDELLDWARTRADFVQCNHPHSWRSKSNRDRSVGNYGRALYGSDENFVASTDSIIKTFSIICTVRGGHISGKHRNSEERTYRQVHSDHYRRYLDHLNLGFHLSPGASQDTHGKNPGTVTAARTAVWAKSCTYNDVMAAFKANRVVATEDDELAVAFQVKYKDKLYWMGETVPLGADEADIELQVTVQQGPNPENGAEVDEGPYTIEILSDADGVGGREAAVWDTITDVTAGTTKLVPLPVVAGEYIFLRVTEDNGQDNAVGDGVDEFINDTGDHGSDGKRDDLNDSAWTTPIWFTGEAAPAKFAWSRRSGVFHDHDCWAVRYIGQGNLRTGETAPPNKEKHNCSK